MFILAVPFFLQNFLFGRFVFHSLNISIIKQLFPHHLVKLINQLINQLGSFFYFPFFDDKLLKIISIIFLEK